MKKKKKLSLVSILEQEQTKIDKYKKAISNFVPGGKIAYEFDALGNTGNGFVDAATSIAGPLGQVVRTPTALYNLATGKKNLGDAAKNAAVGAATKGVGNKMNLGKLGQAALNQGGNMAANKMTQAPQQTPVAGQMQAPTPQTKDLFIAPGGGVVSKEELDELMKQQQAQPGGAMGTQPTMPAQPAQKQTMRQELNPEKPTKPLGESLRLTDFFDL